MIEFICGLIPDQCLATAVMSFVPLIELKGGIVFARGAGLSFFMSFLLAYVGSTAVVVPVFFLLKPVLRLLKKIKIVAGFAERIENYFKKTADDTLEKRRGARRSETFYKALGVFVFVAIPLPMTGVWTGTAIAVFLDMRFKDAVLPIALGNVVAGAIISLLAELCIVCWDISVLDYILYALFALAIVLLAVTIIKVSRSKTKKDVNGEER